MATHSSILAWEILWREVPGRLQPTGSQKDWDTILQLNNNNDKLSSNLDRQFYFTEAIRCFNFNAYFFHSF